MLILIVILGLIYGVIFGVVAGYIYGKVNISMFNVIVRIVSAEVAITFSSTLAILTIFVISLTVLSFAPFVPDSFWKAFIDSVIFGILLGFFIRKFLISKKQE